MSQLKGKQPGSDNINRMRNFWQGELLVFEYEVEYLIAIHFFHLTHKLIDWQLNFPEGVKYRASSLLLPKQMQTHQEAPRSQSFYGKFCGGGWGLGMCLPSLCEGAGLTLAL